jgi:long-chain acyl-CoA synthetase
MTQLTGTSLNVPIPVQHQTTRLAPTLPAQFLETARKRPDAIALRRKEFGLWKGITWREYEAQVQAVAGALLEWGVHPGEGVGLLGENRPEWVIADLGIQMACAVTAAIYATNAPDGVRYVIDHSDSRTIILENAEQLDKVLEVRASLPKLERIVVMDLKGLQEFSDAMVVSFETMLETGHKWLQQNPGKLEAAMNALRSEDPALIIYTSGTTGRPKGAVLSHKNMLFAARAVASVETLTEHEEALSFLPLSHIVERLLSVAQPIVYGYTVNFVENPETVLENLREVRPTVFFAVPRVWEKLMSAIDVRMNRADSIKRLAYRWAAKQGRKGALRSLESQAPGLASQVADVTVLRSLKQKLGLDRARYVLSGAAPIAPSVLEFFHGIGVRIREGYGQTEGAAAATICQGWPIVLGTVGQVLKGIEVQIAEDGEILIRGDNVFLGYHKDPQTTLEVLQNGWLHSGDVGSFDAKGNLSITGRKKDIFITAAGKNIAPAYLENKLKASSYINDAVLVGDGKPYLTALIILDEETVSEWAQAKKLPFTTYGDLVGNPEIVKLIESEIEAVNSTLARVEGIKKFRILPKRLHQEDGDVTPTLKVKRSAIMQTYSGLVDEMYRG